MLCEYLVQGSQVRPLVLTSGFQRQEIGLARTGWEGPYRLAPGKWVGTHMDHSTTGFDFHPLFKRLYNIQCYPPLKLL